MLQFAGSICLAARRWLVALIALAAGIGSATGQTFSNAGIIRIPGSGSGPGPASPYPATIVVSGLTQPVGDVTVTLSGLSHTFAADVGVLLVGPGGKSVVLMANAGGNCDLSSINLRFADGAPPLPTGCIAAGTYSPTVYGNPTFSAPAPASPYGNALSVFSGTNGNGTWNLFVIDDAFLDSGSIAGGWSITFSTPMVTYQGRLDQGGAPVHGTADLRFSLFTAPTGAATALATHEIDNVTVQEGVFTVELPLNSSLFDNTPRWLEIAVRSPAGSGAFTTLSGRQPLNWTPLALHARTAAFATAAVSAGIATRAESATTAISAASADRATAADSATFATSAGHADTADLATAATRLDAPDGSPIAAVFVTNTGDVGIPIATAGNKLSVFGTSHFTDSIALGPNLLAARGGLLHVSDGGSTAPAQAAAQVLVEGNPSSYINLMARDSGEHGVTFGSPTSSVHGGVYYTNSVGMDFRTGNNLSRVTINSSGNVGIGVGVSGGSIDAKFHVSHAGRVAKFDRVGSDGELVAFARDDGVIGNITVSGGVVSYNAFTGSHWAWLKGAPERGVLVSMTGDNRRAGNREDWGEVIYGAQITATANDPACLGAYLAPAEGLSVAMPGDCHQIMAVGNGELWVVNMGRDISPGDYLISSDTPGCAMVDDPARFPVGNVIARAAGAVRWQNIPASANGQQRYRLSVLFGSFARTRSSFGAQRAAGAPVDAAADESLSARVLMLEGQNAALRARLDLIEKELTAGTKPR